MNIFNFNKKLMLLGLAITFLGIVLCIIIFACLGFDINQILKNSGNIYSPINWSSK
ncbi:hypothetical protein LBO01_22720 [Companilactobacillus paralimentarius]|nr:hypothetical protein LBO01_22720 [Companilactobacillus paralimentarius]